MALKYLYAPSGAKAGTAYGVIPNSASADFSSFVSDTDGTRVDKNGFITDVEANVPRIDYTGGGCPSLLLEPTSTNYLQYSEDFSQSFYSKFNASISDYSEVSPQGTYNAKTITDSGAGGTGGCHINRYSLGGLLPSDGDYAYSIFAKKGTRKICRIEVGNLDGIPGAVVNFNLDTGEIFSTSGTAFNSKLIEPYKNGWYKLSVTLTISNKQNNQFIRFRLLTDDGNGNLNLDGTNTMHFFGAQVEKQSYATSYIPNYGIYAGVTRSADDGNSTGDISSEFDSREGTFFFEGSFLDFSSANRVSLNSSVTTFQDRISISTDNTRFLIIYEAGDVGGSFPVNVSDIYANIKIAVKWSSGSVVCYTNGTESFDRTNIGDFSQNSLDRVTLANANESLPFKGRVKQFRVYDEALSNAEMVELTTL